MKAGRDVWWHRALDESEHARSSSRSTSTPSTRCTSCTPRARPASRRACCTPPAATWSARRCTHKYVFDLKEEDVYWCTADIGWVTGHSYIVYGPLANGATCVMYEGSPDYPGQGPLLGDRREVRRHDPVHRADGHPHLHALGQRVSRTSTTCPACACSARSASRSIPRPGSGTASYIGGDRCPVVDTWWHDRDRPDPDHAAAGHHRRSSRARRRSRSRRSRPTCWTSRATACPLGRGGYLVLQRPWPAMARTIWGDAERYKTQYWSRFPGSYFTGDGAKRDEEGYFWLLGRVDDVLNVAGPPHRHDGGRDRAGLAPVGGRGGRHRHHPRDQGPGHRRVRHPARRLSRAADDGRRAAQPRRREDRRRSPSPTRSSSPPSCPRRAAPRSCAACCATSPKARSWATRPRWPTRRSWPRSRSSTRARVGR